MCAVTEHEIGTVWAKQQNLTLPMIEDSDEWRERPYRRGGERAHPQRCTGG